MDCLPFGDLFIGDSGTDCSVTIFVLLRRLEMKKKAKRRNRNLHQVSSVNGAARAAISYYKGKCAGGKTNKSGMVYDHLEHMT